MIGSGALALEPGATGPEENGVERNGIGRRADRQSGWSTTALLPLLVSALVICAAIYSFGPRVYPPVEPTQVAPDGLLVTGLVRNGERVIATGEQGQILFSDTPTSNVWRNAQVEPQRGSNLVRVLAVDDRVMLAAGHDSWIVRSEDGGERWDEVAFDPERSEPLLALGGPYDGRLYALGGFGQFLVSTDQGRTWQRETHEALGDYHLNAITKLADGNLLIAGERGLLAISCDHGRSWTRLPEIYAGSFFGALSLPDGGLLVHGMRGNAFVTADRHTWYQSAIPGTLSLFGSLLDDDGAIVLLADNDTVLRSRDGGRSFEVASHGDNLRLVTALPIEGDGWIVAGEGGVGIRRPAVAGGAS